LRIVTTATDSQTANGSDDLLELLARTARGPRRDGVFALWLVLRVTEGLASATPATERAERRRVTNLEKRLASLTLPPPLRRALQSSLALLKEPGEDAPLLALRQLVAPVRETLGQEAGTAVERSSKGG
jgi:hypothetical protein